jgi:hypothetical protein
MSGKNFSPLHSIQTASRAHLASYLMGTADSFARDKVTRLRKINKGRAIPPLPHMSSWHTV